ncbi:hypothetical protein V8B55DRAFT_1417179 [Mucor lusitanicus]
MKEDTLAVLVATLALRDTATVVEYFVFLEIVNIQFWSFVNNVFSLYKLLSSFQRISTPFRAIFVILSLDGCILVQGTFWYCKTPARLDFGGSRCKWNRMAFEWFKALTGTARLLLGWTLVALGANGTELDIDYRRHPPLESG